MCPFWEAVDSILGVWCMGWVLQTILSIYRQKLWLVLYNLITNCNCFENANRISQNLYLSYNRHNLPIVSIPLIIPFTSNPLIWHCQTAWTNREPTSWYLSLLFATSDASSLSVEQQMPGMSSSHIVSVSVNAKVTVFSRSSSVKTSFTSSLLCWMAEKWLNF